ncbi:hypothetical protein [Paraburkholderia sp. J41]|uniref:hypothetical protein n=1 Tax=Paraburkholderia sp. J41 TaxID=2805433 RepID=UPI002AC318DB|nr:hypothetical protein [Paraburkholderia sp. J41]
MLGTHRLLGGEIKRGGKTTGCAQSANTRILPDFASRRGLSLHEFHNMECRCGAPGGEKNGALALRRRRRGAAALRAEARQIRLLAVFPVIFSGSRNFGVRSLNCLSSQERPSQKEAGFRQSYIRIFRREGFSAPAFPGHLDRYSHRVGARRVGGERRGEYWARAGSGANLKPDRLGSEF